MTSFYALPEERASKGVADWRMLRRKLPDEIFVGRRTLPHQLFGRDDVAAYLANVERRPRRRRRRARRRRRLRRVRPHPATRAPGGPGVVGWPGHRPTASASIGWLAAFDALDGSDSFVHPDAMAAVAASGKSAERAALAVIVTELGLALAELPGSRVGPRPVRPGGGGVGGRRPCRRSAPGRGWRWTWR